MTPHGPGCVCMDCDDRQRAKRATAQGWLCPRCGTVWAPTALRCTCRPPRPGTTQRYEPGSAPDRRTYPFADGGVVTVTTTTRSDDV